MTATQDETQALLEQFYQNLHPVVREAISSGDVEAHMRKLATKHHLHLDQWQLLENEVKLTLIGLRHFEDFEGRIKAALKLSPLVAKDLAADISAIVFIPIREQMERSLEHPSAKEEEGTPIEDLTQEILKGTLGPASGTPAIDTQFGAVAPGTPTYGMPAPAAAAPVTPPPPPEEPKPTIARTEVPPSVKGGLSSERKDVRSDPYRIPPDAA